MCLERAGGPLKANKVREFFANLISNICHNEDIFIVTMHLWERGHAIDEISYVIAAGLSLTSKEGFISNCPHRSADAGLGCPVMV